MTLAIERLEAVSYTGLGMVSRQRAVCRPVYE